MYQSSKPSQTFGHSNLVIRSAMRRAFTTALALVALALTAGPIDAVAAERSRTVEVPSAPAISSQARPGRLIPQRPPSDDNAAAAENELDAAGRRARRSTFRFFHRNYSGNTVYFKFFSQSRRWVWPSNTTAWVSPPDRQQRVVNLSCQRREKICLGGWWPSNPNVYWGVGPRGDQSCSNCCYICNGGQAAGNFVQ